MQMEADMAPDMDLACGGLEENVDIDGAASQAAHVAWVAAYEFHDDDRRIDPGKWAGKAKAIKMQLISPFLWRLKRMLKMYFWFVRRMHYS